MVSPTERSRWFSEEVHPHDSQLKAYLRRTYPYVCEVDDVIQESYLRIWKARAVQPIQSAKAFLFRIARNIALDSVRRRHASPLEPVGDLDRLPVIDERSSVADTVSTNEKIALLADAIDTLPPRCREIIVLCKLQGKSYREVAARLGLSEKTIAEQVYRGVQRLGEELNRRGVSSFRE